jgi:hypothetical protein
LQRTAGKVESRAWTTGRICGSTGTP